MGIGGSSFCKHAAAVVPEATRICASLGGSVCADDFREAAQRLNATLTFRAHAASVHWHLRTDVAHAASLHAHPRPASPSSAASSSLFRAGFGCLPRRLLLATNQPREQDREQSDAHDPGRSAASSL